MFLWGPLISEFDILLSESQASFLVPAVLAATSQYSLGKSSCAQRPCSPWHSTPCQQQAGHATLRAPQERVSWPIAGAFCLLSSANRQEMGAPRGLPLHLLTSATTQPAVLHAAPTARAAFFSFRSPSSASRG